MFLYILYSVLRQQETNFASMRTNVAWLWALHFIVYDWEEQINLQLLILNEWKLSILVLVCIAVIVSISESTKLPSFRFEKKI